MTSLWYIVGLGVLTWVVNDVLSSAGKQSLARLVDAAALMLAIMGGVLPLLARLLTEIQSTMGGGAW